MDSRDKFGYCKKIHKNYVIDAMEEGSCCNMEVDNCPKQDLELASFLGREFLLSSYDSNFHNFHVVAKMGKFRSFLGQLNRV